METWRAVTCELIDVDPSDSYRRRNRVRLAELSRTSVPIESQRNTLLLMPQSSEMGSKSVPLHRPVGKALSIKLSGMAPFMSNTLR